MTGGEEMDEFEAEMQRRVAELRSRPNGGYPEDYRDPEWSTDAEFCDVVIPARATALERSLNEVLADLLPEGTRFEWGTKARQ
jgi:hypothetical protein